MMPLVQIDTGTERGDRVHVVFEDLGEQSFTGAEAKEFAEAILSAARELRASRPLRRSRDVDEQLRLLDEE